MKFEIKGQVRGGKNNLKITRTGHRYPDPGFVAWSGLAAIQIKAQLYQYRDLMLNPISTAKDWAWSFDYTPSDNHRRDATAVLDAVFHVLEQCKVVTDDRWIANLNFVTRQPDKANAGIIIDITRRI